MEADGAGYWPDSASANPAGVGVDVCIEGMRPVVGLCVCVCVCVFVCVCVVVGVGVGA